MNVTHSPGLPPLAIFTPHPQLPRTYSSVSSSLSSPRTPRTPSCSSNTLFTESTNTNNRNSTDSWNSSNADDLEWEWKPDQILLLSRTLDALPAHLVTPFNGPIPPSNLLDKIARGIALAKGPVEWPHSLRATRVKLIEIARDRAKELKDSIAEVGSDVEMDEANDRTSYGRQSGASGKIGIKRPLYRQSSMDFISTADIRDNNNIPCLTDRIQRTNRLISKPTYHPFTRTTAKLSPSNGSGNASSLLSPSTPSSSTLNTLSSFSSMNRVLRRTSSNISSTSASSMSVRSGNGGVSLQDPRVHRIRRTESFYGPPTPPKDVRHKENIQDSPPTAGVKRSPSFGALAQEAKRILGGGLHINVEENHESTASSDEEEKVRDKGAKKMRVKDSNGAAPTTPTNIRSPLNSPPSAASCSPKKMRSKSKVPGSGCKLLPAPNSPNPERKKKGGAPVSKDSPSDAERKILDNRATAAATTERRRPSAPMNLQRNPSILGAELPQISNSALPARPTEYSYPHSPRGHHIRSRQQDQTHIVDPGDVSPIKFLGSPPKVKTLRRVQRTIGRRISFGSLVPSGEDADNEGEGELNAHNQRRQRELGQLGSAFQME